MIEVRNEVKVYAIGGYDTDDPRPVIVVSGFTNSDFVRLSIDNVDYLVDAEDLKAAIENASNIGYES